MFIQNLQYKLHKLNTAQIITLSFAGVIFVGGLILWLPFCTAAGQTTSFSDAMFTATTCVCVTGLVTVTTATHWSLIGKLVILLLIQIGGIGLIALASVIFISLNKKISLKNRRMIQESYNLEQMSGSGNSGEKSGSLRICSGRNRSRRLCVLLCTRAWTGERSGAGCFYSSFSLLQRRDRSLGREQSGRLCNQSSGECDNDGIDYCFWTWL